MGLLGLTANGPGGPTTDSPGSPTVGGPDGLNIDGPCGRGGGPRKKSAVAPDKAFDG